MEVMLAKHQLLHLRVRGHDARWVLALVELRHHQQSRRGSRVPDELDDGLECPQRLAPPVLCDVACSGPS